MATIQQLDRTKYDVMLNWMPYRVRSVTKDDAPEFVPRFNTGQPGENDLDMLKSEGLLNFSGGMLQEMWEDNQRVATIKRGVYDRLSNYLYPTPQKDTVETVSIGTSGPSQNYTARVVRGGYVYIADRVYDSGDKNRILKIDTSGTVTTLATMPTAVYNADPITSMIVYDGNIIIASSDATMNLYSINSSDAFTDMGTGNAINKLTVFNDQIYGTHNNETLRYYDSTGPTMVEIDKIGDSGRNVNDMVTYQNVIYMAKDDGLWAYDGVDVYLVLSKETAQDGWNHMKEYRGWLYLLDEGKLSRFNGVTYEFLYDLTEVGVAKGLDVANDRLYFGVQVSRDVSSIVGGKGGADSTVTETCAVYYYDTVGLYCYDEITITDQDYQNLWTFDGQPYIGVRATVANGDTNIFTWPKDEEFRIDEANTFNDLVVTTSVFHGGYPNVKKVLHRWEIDFLIANDADVDVAGDVYIRTKNKLGQWSDWSAVGATISGASSAKQDLNDRDAIVFYEMQLKYESGGSQNVGLKRISFRYTLLPQKRDRFIVTFICQGADKYNPEQEKDGTVVAEGAKQLRDHIYECVRQADPIPFVADVWTQLNENIASSGGEGTDIDVSPKAYGWPANQDDAGNDYNETTYFQVGTEVMSMDGATNNKDSLALVERALMGTSSSAHSIGDQVDRVHRVVATRIISERMIHDPNTENEYRSTPDYGMESEIQVELVEV